MAKKKLNQLDPASVTAVRLIGHADPVTGKMNRGTVAQLLALFTANTPVKTYANEAALLANTDLVIGYLALVSDTGTLYLYNGPVATDIGNYTEIGGGSEHFQGVYISDSALTSAVPSADAGDYAFVDQGIDYPVELWIWDESDTEWVQSGATGGTVLSVAGTTNRITSSGGATPVIDIDAAYDAAIAASLALKAPLASPTFTGTPVVPGYQPLVNTDVAITDAASMDLTAIKHTLTTALGRTFTISFTGDDITLEITLSATSATQTFPATALCVSEGVASGDNTCPMSGVSGDIYIIAIKKIGSNYRVVCKNFGQ